MVVFEISTHFIKMYEPTLTFVVRWLKSTKCINTAATDFKCVFESPGKKM